MSVWLCRYEPVKRPLYIRELDLHIYSSQELSYIIIHNPLFVLEGFVDDRLFTFVREQLDMGFLALKMERLQKAGESNEEILSLFLQEADYCTAAEITQFRQKAAAFKKMLPAEYQKERADYLFQIGQYLNAVSVYNKILEMLRDTYINEFFLGKVHSNIGACYAHLFQFERAAKAYEKSYFYSKDPSSLKSIYFLTAMEPEMNISAHSKELLVSELNPSWNEEFSEIREAAKGSEELKNLDELFEKDSLRRQNGAEELISDWKRKYRSMQSPS